MPPTHSSCRSWPWAGSCSCPHCLAASACKCVALAGFGDLVVPCYLSRHVHTAYRDKAARWWLNPGRAPLLVPVPSRAHPWCIPSAGCRLPAGNRDPAWVVCCSHPLSCRLCPCVVSSASSSCLWWPCGLPLSGVPEDVQTAREGTQEPLRVSTWALPCERAAPNSQGRGPKCSGFGRFRGRPARVVAVLPRCLKQPGVGTPVPQEACWPTFSLEPVLHI